MKKFFLPNDQVLPRPLEKLPEYAHAKAGATWPRSWSRRSQCPRRPPTPSPTPSWTPPRSASASATRRGPQVEEIAVPGGKVLGLRTKVWSRRIMPDPRNPRTRPDPPAPVRRRSGHGGEDSRFRPVPEPRSPDGQARHVARSWWSRSSPATTSSGRRPRRRTTSWPRTTGGIDPVPGRDGGGVAGRRPPSSHADGSAPVTVLNTAEGSSRTRRSTTSSAPVVGRSLRGPGREAAGPTTAAERGLRAGTTTPEQADGAPLRADARPDPRGVQAERHQHGRLPDGGEVAGGAAPRRSPQAVGRGPGERGAGGRGAGRAATAAT